MKRAELVDNALVPSRDRQHTLKQSFGCSGLSLHGGEHVTVEVGPAEVDTGIVFCRTDRSGEQLAGRWQFSVDSPLCTTLARGGRPFVRTIEHMMCALYACGIDNAVVEIDHDELPIMDGSAKPFIELIEAAGIQEQSAQRRFLKILKPISFQHGKSYISVEPSDEFRLKVVLGVPRFGLFEWSGLVTQDRVRNDIASARTFGRLEGALPLMIASRLGGPRLLRGASLKHAVVFWRGRVLNRGGLRFEDEFVRHHTLDAIGDLYLAGAPILGNVVAEHTRHGLTQQFLKKLMSDQTAWALV